MERDNMTFADQELLMRIEGSKHYLKNVDTLINWKQIRKLLSSLDLKRKNGFGRDCYEPEKMFRVMLIQKWNNLSDYQMEEQLKFNLMYMHFCRFSFGNPTPDHSTICRWRQRFSEGNLYEKLLNVINNQLRNHNLIIREGAILDATLIESQARPRKKEIIETEPVGDAEIPEKQVFQATELTVEESKDPDARWLKKGKKSTYGYKGHVSVDQETGLIQAVVVTPANQYDGHVLPELVEVSELKENTPVYADKGYDSEENHSFLKKKKLVSRIMRKRRKNQPPSEEQTASNRSISKKRYVVERSFGSLKKRYGWSRSIYIGLQKTKDYLLLGAIAFNLKRSVVILRGT